MNRDEIRSLLQSGHSIDEVCTHYRLTFKELVSLMSKGASRDKPRKRPKKYLYLSQVHGKWIIRRSEVHFGTYYSLADAMRVRDWFMFHRWDKRCIDRACSEVGVERCTYKKK